MWRNIRRERVCLSGAGSSTGPLNEAPIATISGPTLSLSYRQGIALDSSRNIYVADDGDGACDGTQACLSMSGGSNGGNVAPIATISGSNTGLSYPIAMRWIPAITSMWRT